MTKVKCFYIESELVFEVKPKGHKFQDLEGQKFSRLVVIGFAGQTKLGSMSQWFCRCDCGNITKIFAGALKNGVTGSCGCLHKEIKTTHGHKSGGNCSKIYGIWASMIERCQNPKHKQFKDYGGRGITVCERWHSFENFLADMGERPEGKTLDRKENDKGYYKENCRWATIFEQANNKRNSILIPFKGEQKTISQLSQEIGLSKFTIYTRLHRGWPIERALIK